MLSSYRVHRSVSDLEHCQNSQKKLRQANKVLQNTVAKHEEQERQLRLQHSNLQMKLKLHSDEVCMLLYILVVARLKIGHAKVGVANVMKCTSKCLSISLRKAFSIDTRYLDVSLVRRYL